MVRDREWHLPSNMRFDCAHLAILYEDDMLYFLLTLPDISDARPVALCWNVQPGARGVASAAGEQTTRIVSHVIRAPFFIKQTKYASLKGTVSPV